MVQKLRCWNVLLLHCHLLFVAIPTAVKLYAAIIIKLGSHEVIKFLVILKMAVRRLEIPLRNHPFRWPPPIPKRH